MNDILIQSIRRAGQDESNREDFVSKENKQDKAICPLCKHSVLKTDLKINKKVRMKVCGECRKKL